jgi:mono/diheme cytochrome c family protein
VRLALATAALILAGCSTDSFVGPLAYTRSERLAIDLRTEEGQPKSRLQARVNQVMDEVFGDAPNHMKVPPGSGLRDGGAWLAANAVLPSKERPGRVFYERAGTEGTTDLVFIQGGYGLYRLHCLHCHGLSGDGMGPTAPYLWPRPRDYRRGVFKFTSTNSMKPSRDDLRRIITHGVHGTSMPAFESLMSKSDIEQVIEYVIFLAARGETELALVNEAMSADDADADTTVTNELGLQLAQTVFENWKLADTPESVLNPPIPRKPATPESIASGKTLFLGKTKENLQCAGCHGADGKGNGVSFIDRKTFNNIVFNGAGLERFDELLVLERAASVGGQSESGFELAKLPATMSGTLGEGLSREVATAPLVAALLERGDLQSAGPGLVKLAIAPEALAKLQQERDLWVKGSLDDWGYPLRAANLNLGVYKGGRRPIDLYWRIAKGINGAKMPAHDGIFATDKEKLWDLVNFVMALPYQPDLLKDETAGPIAPVTTGAPAATTALHP